MKKLISAALALIMAISLILGCTSCALFKNYDYVNEAIAQTAALDAVDIETKTTLAVTANGTSETVSAANRVAMKGLQTKSPVFLTEADITLYGETVPATVYYEDTFYYVVTETESVKLASGELIGKTDFANEWQKTVQPFTEDMLKTAEEEVHEDGTKTVTVLADATAFQQTHEAQLADWHAKLVETYVGAYTASTMQVSDTKYIVTVDTESGLLKAFSAVCHIEIVSTSAAGEEITVSAVMENTTLYHGTGDDVSCEAPAGYVDFELTDGIRIDPYKLTKKAIDRARALNDIDADIRLTISASMQGMEMTFPITYDIQVTDALSENPTSALSYHYAVFGTDITEEVYYKDGYYYVDSSESGQSKNKATEELDDSYGHEAQVDFVLQILSEQDLASTEVEKTADGMKKVSLPLTPARFYELYPDLMGPLSEMLGGENGLDVKSPAVTITVDGDGNLQSYAFSFDFVIDMMEGYAMDFHLEYALTYHNFGEPVTVIPVEGWETFLTPAEKNASVFKIVNDAVRKTVESDTLSVYQYSETLTNIGGEGVEIYQELELAAKGLKSDPVYRYQSATELLGSTFCEDVYYEKNTFYINSEMLDVPIKAPSGVAESYNALSGLYAALQEMPDSLAEKAITEIDEDGYAWLYVELTDAEFRSIFPYFANKITSEAIGYPISNVKPGELYAEIYVSPEGEILYYDLNYEFTFRVLHGGVQLDAHAIAYVSFEFEEVSVTPEPMQGYQNFLSYGNIAA